MSVHPDDANACMADMEYMDIPVQIMGHVAADHGRGFLDIF